MILSKLTSRSLKHRSSLCIRSSNLLTNNCKYLPIITCDQKRSFMWPAKAGVALTTFLQWAPPLCFFYLQISGLKTTKWIKENKTTGKLNPLGFVALATNCIVWSVYGVLTNDVTLIIANGLGILFGSYQTSVFHKFSKSSMLKYYLGGALTIGAPFLLSTMLPSLSLISALGYVGCGTAVVLMAAPLAVIRTVIKEKSTSSLPFITSVAVLLNSSTWSAYGLLVAQDMFIVAPNLAGFSAALIQMSLFAKYGIQEPKTLS